MPYFDVTVDKANLLRTLIENREKHLAEYEEAKAAYRDKVALTLDSLVADIRTSDLGQDLPSGLLDLLESLSPEPPAAGMTDPDEVPPVPETPVSRTSDLWVMGGRVICPDCGEVHEL